MAQGALEGLTVLDLTEGVAGPFCTKLMADQGADVIKVERPRLGDWARQRGPFFQDIPGPERSLLFAYLNTNKRSVTLNLDNAFGREAVRKLVRTADVLVESYAPGYLDERGLAPQTLREENPRLVVTSLSLFDRQGPYARWKGAELNLYAMSGLMSLVGGIGRPPLKAGGYQAQYMAGLQACAYTLFAAYRARTTSEGCWVDTSVVQTGGKILAHIRDQEARQATFKEREQERDRQNGVIPCREGHASVTLYYHMVPALADLLGDPSIAKELRPGSGSLAENQEELRAAVAERFKTLTADEAQAEGQKRRLLFTKVHSTRDLLESPHLQARGYFVEVNHPEIGRARQSGPPFGFTASPAAPPRAAPKLGEANEEVLCGRLGCSREDLPLLWATGAI